MNLETIEEKENKLMKRKEFVIQATYDNATPSKEQFQELVAIYLKANKDNIEIYKIISDMGKCSGKIWARIYDEKTFSYGKPVPEGEATEEAKPEEKPAEAPKEEAAEKKEGE